MKKIFFLALSATFFISCTNDEPVTTAAEETSIAEVENYDDIFEKFSNFTVDGQMISDKTKIRELMQSAQVIYYAPEEEEAHFYTTNEKFEKLSDGFKTDLESYEDTYKDSIDGFGLEVDADGAAVHKLEVVDDFAKADYAGISGLSSLGGNSSLTDFAKKIFFIADYDNGNTYFIRLSKKGDIWPANMLAVKMNSIVQSANMSLGITFRNLYNDLGDIYIKNDTNNTEYVYFYERHHYAGKQVVVRLNKNQVTKFSRYIFSNFGSDRPKSVEF